VWRWQDAPLDRHHLWAFGERRTVSLL
jgi:hypothetical protein